MCYGNLLSQLKIKLHQSILRQEVSHSLLYWEKAWESMILWGNIKQIHLGRPLVQKECFQAVYLKQAG